MAPGDTPITLVGNIVADPELRFTPSGAAVANFRVASTPRRFNSQVFSIACSSVPHAKVMARPDGSIPFTLYTTRSCLRADNIGSAPHARKAAPRARKAAPEEEGGGRPVGPPDRTSQRSAEKAG